LNRERRAIESEMQESASAMGLEIEAATGFSLVVHRPDWHAGVVGLLASRLRERYHRPVFAFARDAGGVLKGSGRSIPALHLRDALDLVDKRRPGLLERFGGHAGAAGATLRADALEDFRAAFESVARERLTPADLDERIETDGALTPADLTEEFATLLREQVWGHGFPEPRFRGAFRVRSQRIVGENHLRLGLEVEGRMVNAIRFGCADAVPERIEAVYRLDLNEYQGASMVQLVVERLEPAPPRI